MSRSETPFAWSVNGPAAWPEAPAEMTVTTLVEIEACPRRWALSRAAYPDLWPGQGYPPRVQIGALAGNVVHSTLAIVTTALIKAGCPSVQDPMATKTLKDLGGFTKVVNDCIDRVLKRVATNPRAARLFESASRTLRAQVPELRTRVQAMLCRVRIPEMSDYQTQRDAVTGRRALPTGVFSEIELHAIPIGWKGKADLLVLSPSKCEISDFKTGAPDEGHRFQIQVYALLWSRDSELNPDRRRADRLVLRYNSQDMEVAAPTNSELDDLERQLIARRDAAVQTVSQISPEARPDAETCQYCAVRQLCDNYWTAETQHRIARQAGPRRFVDIEATITGRHGPTSWDAVIELCGDVSPGKSAVLRTSGNVEFKAGDRLRVLDASVALEDERQPLIITFGTLSEAYAV